MTMLILILLLIQMLIPILILIQIPIPIKTTCVKLYINMKMGARDLYIDEVHMALDISHFAVFLFYLNEHFQPKFCLVAVSDIGNFLLCPRY